MEDNHKRILGTFRTTTKYKNNDGKSESLDKIITQYRRCGYMIQSVDENYPELIELIHPFLFMNYAVDWSAVPATRVPKGFKDGNDFGKEVIKTWQDYCWKNKIWNFDSFKLFKSVDELKSVINSVLNGSLYYKEGDYYDLQIKIAGIKADNLSAEEELKEREKRRLKEERALLEAENKVKDAQRVADEIRRRQAAEENEKTSQFYKEMQLKPNSPFSRDDQDVLSNPFEHADSSMLSANSPFEVTDESYILPPIPEPNTRQLIISKSSSGNGYAITHGSKVPKKGMFTPRSIGGVLYLCFDKSDVETGSSNSVIESLWNYYDANLYISFTLRDNMSQNPNITALPIISISVDGIKK